jgi:hypothetical protein
VRVVRQLGRPRRGRGKQHELIELEWRGRELVGISKLRLGRSGREHRVDRLRLVLGIGDDIELVVGVRVELRVHVELELRKGRCGNGKLVFELGREVQLLEFQQRRRA